MLAVVLAVVAAYELAIRRAERALSTDVQHIRSVGEAAARLHQEPRPRVLFLGNSLTGYGADCGAFTDELKRLGLPEASCARAVPDATGISDWYYLFRNDFVVPRHVPDVVIVGFARGHLADDHPLDPRHLGRYFCRLRDVPELFRFDLKTVEERASFLLGYLSAAYGNQDRTKKRLLDVIIPDYRYGERTLNAMSQAAAERREQQAPPAAGPPVTYGRLRRFMEMLRRQGVVGIFVAMPRPEPWPMPEELPGILADGGMLYVDFRRVPGLRNENFPDGMHLDPAGAEIYSRALARRLADVIRPLAASRPASP